MVYVKKWLRTTHAILFRLSNQTVQVRLICVFFFTVSSQQVIFFDHTEILLSSSTRTVVYTDKAQQISRFSCFGSGLFISFPADILWTLLLTLLAKTLQDACATLKISFFIFFRVVVVLITPKHDLRYHSWSSWICLSANARSQT